MAEKSDNEKKVLLSELNSVLSERTEAAVADRLELRDSVCRYVEAEQTRGTSRPSPDIYRKHKRNVEVEDEKGGC